MSDKKEGGVVTGGEEIIPTQCYEQTDKQEKELNRLSKEFVTAKYKIESNRKPYNKIPRVEILREDKTVFYGSVLVDGTELRGVADVKIDMGAGEIPMAVITLYCDPVICYINEKKPKQEPIPEMVEIRTLIEKHCNTGGGYRAQIAHDVGVRVSRYFERLENDTD